MWHDLAGGASARFELFCPGENDPYRILEKGDYLKITIPGPGNAIGDGDDWVQVELLEDNFDAEADESFGIKVRSSVNPETGTKDTAHFFADDATSTFIITRKDTTVTVSYHGRNEIPNTSTQNTLTNIRNAVVASGAAAGFSNLQWNALLRGLLKQ